LRDRTYRLIEIVAWPAAVWGGIELLLRAGTGYPAGATDTVVITACASLTVFLARTRRRMLAAIA
jgi:hypothetical protein